MAFLQRLASCDWSLACSWCSVGAWSDALERRLCSLRGHQFQIKRMGRRMYPHCGSCGYDGPGWEVPLTRLSFSRSRLNGAGTVMGTTDPAAPGRRHAQIVR